MPPGYDNGKFGPEDRISSEQAMTLIGKAMKLTGLTVEFTDDVAKELLAGFADADKPADYAKNSIAAYVKTGIVSGKNGNLLAPKDNITRAEVAVIVKKLLQRSNLV